jgi:hypothetical protein
MKIYCSCCDKVQPVRIDNCRDAKTNEPFQDIVCAECDLVIASGTDIAPPKQWVGLTADEIWKCNKAKSGSVVEFHICYAHQNVLDFAEAIEAKLKEKNGG